MVLVLEYIDNLTPENTILKSDTSENALKSLHNLNMVFINNNENIS